MIVSLLVACDSRSEPEFVSSSSDWSARWFGFATNKSSLLPCRASIKPNAISLYTSHESWLRTPTFFSTGGLVILFQLLDNVFLRGAYFYSGFTWSVSFQIGSVRQECQCVFGRKMISTIGWKLTTHWLTFQNDPPHPNPSSSRSA